MNLREMRAMSGLSQPELSRRSGVGRTRLSLAENGHVRLAADEIEAVDAVLRASIQSRAQAFIEALGSTLLMQHVGGHAVVAD